MRKYVKIFCLGMLFACLIWGCAGGDSVQKYLELGNKYLLEENYEQAIVEFDKIIEIEPMNVEAYLGKAEAYVGLNDPDAAIEALEEGYERTKSDEILRQLEKWREKADAEKIAENKSGIEDAQKNESGLPYFELGFSPEDFTIAGYNIMDGNHISDVEQAAAMIMPSRDEWRSGDEGWYYSKDVYPDFTGVWLEYNVSPEGRWGEAIGWGAVSYSTNNKDVWLSVRDTIVPTNGLPLYKGKIVPEVTSFEDTLDILGIRQLIQAIEEKGSDEYGDKRLEFESQYGRGWCYGYEEEQYFGYQINIYESEFEWELNIEFRDNVIRSVNIRSFFR